MAGRLARSPRERDRLILAEKLGVSPRRLHGWEPKEIHRGIDEEGNQVPIGEAWEIVVQREPEWSENDRNRLLALNYLRHTTGECGYSHEFITSDDDITGKLHDSTCPFCAALAQNDRIRADAEAKAFKDAPPDRPRPSDGRTTSIQIVPPGEAAEEAKRGGGDGYSPRARRRRAPGGSDNGNGPDGRRHRRT